jgi:hypothetical protein
LSRPNDRYEATSCRIPTAAQQRLDATLVSLSSELSSHVLLLLGLIGIAMARRHARSAVGLDSWHSALNSGVVQRQLT